MSPLEALNSSINDASIQNEQSLKQENIDEILPIVYTQLKKMANSLKFRFSGNETLNTTAIVHEAYIKLANADAKWSNELHFYALAAKAMRQILYNHIRKHNTDKRGGNCSKLDIHEIESFLLLNEEIKDELNKLEQALQNLAKHDQRAAQIVECRFYGGMTIEETAKHLGISDATVKRTWITAKAWLIAQIKSS